MTGKPTSTEKEQRYNGDANPNVKVTVVEDPNDPDMVIIRTRKRKKGSRRTTSGSKRKIDPKLRIAIIVIAVILGVFAAAGIALAIAVNVGNVNLHQVFGGLENTPENAVVEDRGQVVEYNGHTYKYNENIVSFLLIGHDDESSYATRPDASCADINALVTIDTSSNKTRVVVVPRNSWVPVDVYGADGSYAATRDLQLTLSHAVMLPSIAECAANTTKSVARVFYNLPITYFIDIDQEVVKEASRAVGGVNVVALESIPSEGYAVGDSVLLEGESAYRYVQYRDVPVFESALDRQARQIQFVKAFASKVSGLGAQGIVNLYRAMSDDITTNLGLPEITYLASCFVTGENAELEISALTGTTEVYTEVDGIEYERYFLDENSVMENTLSSFYTQVD